MSARTILALCAFSVVLMLLFHAFPGLATEDFARETGRACRECHLDPSGGGELNAAGKAFLAGGRKPGMRTRIPPRSIAGCDSPPVSSTC
jgi:hypothetical protein